MLDKQKALKQIAKNCEKMRKLYDANVELAKTALVPFDLPWGGEGCSAEDGYGAGATFYPAGLDDWDKRDTDRSEWISSSQTC